MYKSNRKLCFRSSTQNDCSILWNKIIIKPWQKNTRAATRIGYGWETTVAWQLLPQPCKLTHIQPQHHICKSNSNGVGNNHHSQTTHCCKNLMLLPPLAEFKIQNKKDPITSKKNNASLWILSKILPTQPTQAYQINMASFRQITSQSTWMPEKC